MYEYADALSAVEIARNHFNNAVPEYIDAAIHELICAEQRLNALILQNK